MTSETGRTVGLAIATGGSRRSRPAPQVRADILIAAQALFRERGYERVTLTEIGAAVGLTRGAVLYHYHSKADVLTALLDPFITRLDDLLDHCESAQPPPTPSAVLAGVLDALLTTRAAADVLTRDISGRHALSLNAWAGTQAHRLIGLFVPDSAADPTAVVRGLAALGALTRPLADLPDPISGTHREAILRAAINALRPPERPTRASSAPPGEHGRFGQLGGEDQQAGAVPGGAGPGLSAG